MSEKPPAPPAPVCRHCGRSESEGIHESNHAWKDCRNWAACHPFMVSPPAPRMSGEEFERIGKSEWTLSREDATALWREARRAREEAANLAEADRIAMMELMRRADALAAKDAEIERLKGQYESSHASRLHAEKCLERAEAELKESEADVDRRREWIEKLNDENDELKAEIETLQSLKLDADDHYYNEKARRP